MSKVNETQFNSGEKSIETPYLLIKKNIMTWNDTIIQLSNISYISAANLDTLRFPSLALCLILGGIVLLKESFFAAIILVGIGGGWIYKWYMDNIDPYMGHQYVDDTKKIVYYKDGSSLLTFYSGGCLDVDYDVNGDKAPNREGYDRQRYLYCFTNDSRISWFGNKDIFFGTYGSGQTAATTSRESMITKCKTSPSWCTKLLQNDQWEFKGDYPFKF